MLFVTDSIQLLNRKHLTKNALQQLGEVNIGDQVLRNVQHADDVVVPAKA